MQLTSIVIPTYNKLPLLQQAVAAIRTYTRMDETPYEIVVADNGSQDGTVEWCRQEGLRFVALPYNAGFPVACNKGMRMASGDFFLLLNNDVTVTNNWLPNLHRALASDSRIGIVGPVSNFVSGKQQVECSFRTMEEFQQLAASVNVPDSRKWEETERLVGFCLLFSRAFYQQIGELDECFSPGHYEDDDLCFRARKMGYRLLFCRDVLIHHIGSASFKNQDTAGLQELLQRNRKLFMEKWQIDPHIYI